jgi:cytochrome c biogenesis protein CcmG/thiol:disulfide interchange protein DsbE
MKLGALIPLVIFICTVAVLAAGLDHDPRLVPSPLIDHPAPAFSLPDLFEPNHTVASESVNRGVILVNVWASWCSGCRVEHSQLIDLAVTHAIPILGIDYKDNRSDALRWLKQHGNPYTRVAYDRVGNVGIDFGVYGVPETYVIDQNGIIRYKHTGPITDSVVKQHILPLVDALRAEYSNDV